MLRTLPFFVFIFISFSQKNYTLAEKIELALFHYENEKAFAILDSNLSDISPYRAATFRAAIYFNRYFRDQSAKRQRHFADSMLLVLEATFKDEEKIREEKKEDDLLMLGGAYGFKGMAEFLKKNRVSALMLADNAKDILDELVDIYPTNIDAYFGIGVYNFALGQPPAYLRFLLGILGFSGDKVLGYQQIQLVAKKGKDTRVQSLLFLINHALFTSGDYEKTYPLLKYVPKYLLSSPMYLYKKMQLEYYLGNYRKSLNTWSKLNVLSFPRAPYVYNNSRLFAAKNHIALGNMQKADSLISVIRRSKDRPLGGFAFEIEEAEADKFFALKRYQNAHKLYLRIYNRTTVDKRKDRIEGKLEKIEELTNGKLSY
jgi:hypothetical protein